VVREFLPDVMHALFHRDSKAEVKQ
jgi:hypothetical protein